MLTCRGTTFEACYQAHTLQPGAYTQHYHTAMTCYPQVWGTSSR